MNLPNQVVSIYPPTIIHTTKRYAVFTGQWFEVDDSVTLSDVMKVWVKWTPKQKDVVAKEGNSWKVASSKPGKFYTVSFRSNQWSCQCSGFGFRRDCRHVSEMKKKYGKSN